MRGLHELAPLKRCDIGSREFKPLAFLSFRLEPLMPVSLDPTGVVSSNHVNCSDVFGKLYAQFVFPASCGIGFPNLVETTRLDEIDKTVSHHRPRLVARSSMATPVLLAHAGHIVVRTAASAMVEEFFDEC